MKKGFTLIELLIVIAILGILAGIVLAVINPVRSQQRARDGVMTAQLSKLSTASNIYRAGSNNGCFAADQAALSGSGYLDRWPDGTPPGATYTYVYVNCSAFRVYSSGGNGTVSNWCISSSTPAPVSGTGC